MDSKYILNINEEKEFFRKNKDTNDVLISNSGLQYKVIKEGDGKHPEYDSRIAVNYIGRFINGIEFDRSIDKKNPAKFFLNKIIPGWGEGLQMMKEGSRYEFYIPSYLAYGEKGKPGFIEPYKALIFDITLIDVLEDR